TVTYKGLADLLELVDGVDLVLDATSAHAHPEHARLLAERGIRSVDLTPAALGPPVVPPVNLSEHRDAQEINLVTCGAQATVPVVAAIRSVAELAYAETVSTISSSSAGPGTRANITSSRPRPRAHSRRSAARGRRKRSSSSTPPIPP